MLMLQVLLLVSLLIMTWSRTPPGGDPPDSTPRRVLARHIFTDFYDASPGLPNPQGTSVLFSDYVAGGRRVSVYDVGSDRGRLVTPRLRARSRLSWSPDGRHIVFLDREPDRHGVWIVDPASGRESLVVPARDGRLDYPRMLPDGRVTALLVRDADTAWVTYAKGVSQPRVLSPNAAGWAAPSLSPDGARVAYLRSGSGSGTLDVRDLATGADRVLATGLRFGWDLRVEWSSRGEELYLAAARPGDSLLAGWRVPIDGRPMERLDAGDRDVLAVVPLTGNRLAMTTYRSRTWIGLIPVSGGKPNPLPPPAAGHGFLPSWRPDGRAVGFITASWRRLLVPVDFDLGVQSIDSSGQAVGAASPLVTEEHEDYGAAWSPDGRWLAFHGHLQNSDDIWIRRAAATSGRPRRLTSFGPGADTGEPDWSPDGRNLAFSSHGPAADERASWVYTLSLDPETGEATGQARRLPLPGFSGSVMGARFSPDGRRIAFYGRSPDDGRVTVHTVDAAGGPPSAIVSFPNGEPYGAPEWSVDARSLFYSRNDGVGRFRIWRVDLATGATEPITSGPLAALQPSVSPDGRTLAVTLWDNLIEVVATEVRQP